jgi:hypothetical protein
MTLLLNIPPATSVGETAAAVKLSKGKGKDAGQMKSPLLCAPMRKSVHRYW